MKARLPGHFENTATATIDLRPEFIKYRDEGCEFADACLDCPFEQCLFDDDSKTPYKFKRHLIEHRNREIITRWQRGESVKELAARFNVTERTIRRVIKNEC